MGFFFHGVPDYLIDWGRTNLSPSSAVETGTFWGDSALLLADAFGACTTIERDPDLALRARDRFADDDRIVILEGSSRTMLPRALVGLDRPPFVWLDAHWSGGPTAGSDDPCPVLAEIDAVARAFGTDSFVAIDDARIFAAADPGDEINNSWPTLYEVLGALENQGLRSFIIDDVIVGVSPTLADSIARLVPQTWMGLNRTIHIYEAQRRAEFVTSNTNSGYLRSKVKAGMIKARRLASGGG